MKRKPKPHPVYFSKLTYPAYLDTFNDSLQSEFNFAVDQVLNIGGNGATIGIRDLDWHNTSSNAKYKLERQIRLIEIFKIFDTMNNEIPILIDWLKPEFKHLHTVFQPIMIYHKLPKEHELSPKRGKQVFIDFLRNIHFALPFDEFYASRFDHHSEKHNSPFTNVVNILNETNPHFRSLTFKSDVYDNGIEIPALLVKFINLFFKPDFMPVYKSLKFHSLARMKRALYEKNEFDRANPIFSNYVEGEPLPYNIRLKLNKILDNPVYINVIPDLNVNAYVSNKSPDSSENPINVIELEPITLVDNVQLVCFNEPVKRTNLILNNQDEAIFMTTNTNVPPFAIPTNVRVILGLNEPTWREPALIYAALPTNPHWQQNECLNCTQALDYITAAKAHFPQYAEKEGRTNFQHYPFLAVAMMCQEFNLGVYDALAGIWALVQGYVSEDAAEIEPSSVDESLTSVGEVIPIMHPEEFKETLPLDADVCAGVWAGTVILPSDPSWSADDKSIHCGQAVKYCQMRCDNMSFYNVLGDLPDFKEHYLYYTVYYVSEGMTVREACETINDLAKGYSEQQGYVDAIEEKVTTVPAKPSVEEFFYKVQHGTVDITTLASIPTWAPTSHNLMCQQAINFCMGMHHKVTECSNEFGYNDYKNFYLYYVESFVRNGLSVGDAVRKCIDFSHDVAKMVAGRLGLPYSEPVDGFDAVEEKEDTSDIEQELLSADSVVHEMNETTLKIETFKKGNKVNSPEVGVRITHLPTGLYADASDSRSVHKNKEAAMALLQMKLDDHTVRPPTPIADVEMSDFDTLVENCRASFDGVCVVNKRCVFKSSKVFKTVFEVIVTTDSDSVEFVGDFESVYTQLVNYADGLVPM